MDAVNHVPTEELINVADLSKILKIKPNTLYKMAIDRKIPSIKLGKVRRFRLSDVMAAVGQKYTVAMRTK